MPDEQVVHSETTVDGRWSDCCFDSFADKGIKERFELSVVGDEHVCPTCGSKFRFKERPGGPVWTRVHGGH